MREFAFELRLCAHLEATGEWPVVARQLGASVHGGGSNRVVDALLVGAGPAFDDRVAIAGESIPPAAVESDAGVGRWRPVADVVDGPPERARRVADRAAEAGFFEVERRDGREVVRYPDWFGRLVGVENKPDLGDPGGLATQLRKDVSLGLLDAVVLATESYVTGAHLNRIPDAVGVWRVDFDAEAPVEVLREPTPLAVDEPGIEVLERRPARTDVRVVDAEAKARKRQRMAERAYGKGWRVAEFPACARVEDAAVAGAHGLPYCEWKERLVDPASECGPDCPGHEAADPPAVDPDADRERRTPWVAEPGGRARQQAGLDRFS